MQSATALEKRLSAITQRSVDYLIREIEIDHNTLPIENVFQAFINRVEQHQIAPLLHDFFDIEGVFNNQSLSLAVEQLYKRQQKHSAIRFDVFKAIIDKANKNDIPIIALKGMALAPDIYPAIIYRQCSDMDILYRHEDKFVISQLIRELGFDLPEQHHTRWVALSHHLPNATLKCDGMTISLELHHNAINRDLPWSIDFSQSSYRHIRYQNCEYLVFDHFHQLFHLCVHCSSTGGITKLINMIDIVLYVEKYADDIDWNHIRTTMPIVINTFRLIHPIIRFDISEKLNEFFELADIEINGAGRTMQGVSYMFKRDVSLIKRIKALLLPPKWWLHLRYSIKPGKSAFWYYCFFHPKELVRLFFLRMVSLIRCTLK